MKLSDYKMPSEKCDLIAEMLATLFENDTYIIMHEQKKVLADSEYFKKWRMIQ